MPPPPRGGGGAPPGPPPGAPRGRGGAPPPPAPPRAGGGGLWGRGPPPPGGGGGGTAWAQQRGSQGLSWGAAFPGPASGGLVGPRPPARPGLRAVAPGVETEALYSAAHAFYRDRADRPARSCGLLGRPAVERRPRPRQPRRRDPGRGVERGDERAEWLARIPLRPPVALDAERGRHDLPRLASEADDPSLAEHVLGPVGPRPADPARLPRSEPPTVGTASCREAPTKFHTQTSLALRVKLRSATAHEQARIDALYEFGSHHSGRRAA